MLGGRRRGESSKIVAIGGKESSVALPRRDNERALAMFRRYRALLVLASLSPASLSPASLLLADCLISAPALAHDSWISRGGHRNGAGEWCCGEGDCFVVPGQQISFTPQGYRLNG